jgi:hypothetical protein
MSGLDVKVMEVLHLPFGVTRFATTLEITSALFTAT